MGLIKRILQCEQGKVVRMSTVNFKIPFTQNELLMCEKYLPEVTFLRVFDSVFYLLN